MNVSVIKCTVRHNRNPGLLFICTQQSFFLLLLWISGFCYDDMFSLFPDDLKIRQLSGKKNHHIKQS